MRDVFEGLDQPTNDDNPATRAQRLMRTPLPKRFYKEVEVGPHEDQYAILLDGKSVRTPARNVLALPSAAAAEILAAEWRAQGKKIDPGTMPATRLANTALDGVAPDPQPVAEDILRFAGTDMICYRAGEPEGLVGRQSEAWDPLIDWARSVLGARFNLAEGVMHVDQPRESIGALGIHLRRFDDPISLAAIHVMTTLTGSAVIALAVAMGELSPEQGWSAAHVDEDWNIAQWGEDAEAAARRERRWAEMRAAASLLKAVRTSA